MKTAPRIAISISESPDLARLGLGKPHLEEAMVEIARYLLIAGASLAYGGDLRVDGFTLQLFEMARSYRRETPERPPIANYLAWPAHRALRAGELEPLEERFLGAGRLLLLDEGGRTLSADERGRRLAAAPRGEETAAERAAGFSAMRRRMAADCDARVLLGGKVQGYQGVMPGILEEALLTLGARKPLYPLGGFGGATRDLIHALQGRDDPTGWRRPASETGPGYAEAVAELGRYSPEDLGNGLSREENEALFVSVQPPVILRYLLRGLANLGLIPEAGESGALAARSSPPGD